MKKSRLSPPYIVTGLTIALTAGAAPAALRLAIPLSTISMTQGTLLDLHEVLATGLICLIALHVSGAGLDDVGPGRRIEYRERTAVDNPPDGPLS